jgi:hypothetical protein
MRYRLSRCLVPTVALLALVALAAVPSIALANVPYEHIYCSQYLAVSGTCPPNGSSVYVHLELNSANAGGASHATCLDDYYERPAPEKSEFTPAHCMYYSNETAIQISSGQWGYPRAWNAGTIEHLVVAEEWGYHTS